jgi:autotransporter-associated beta strand protein
MKKTVYLLAVVSALAIPTIVCAQTLPPLTANALLDETANSSTMVELPAPLPPVYPPNPDVATNGTIATQTAQFWSTAPWAPGGFPDGGGTATFNTATNVTGAAPVTTVFTLDVTPTLSGVTYNSPFSYQIAPSGVNTLNLDPGGATFNMILSALPSPTLTILAHPITAPISGGGVNGLTKTGIGTLTLAGTNTYTGGTHITGGLLAISAAAAVGDATLGATGAGNGISFDGGTLANNITGGWTTSRDISLGNGGGTFLLFTAATVNGVVSGNGSLTINNSRLTLTNANTYTGATILNSSFSGLTLNGNGSINQSASYDFAGGTVAAAGVILDNSVTNNADRLNDSGPITDRGAAITLIGNAGAATNEVAGALTLANGSSTITVSPNAAQAASLNFSSITRQNNSTLFVRGTNLGAAPGSGVAQITSTASPGTLVGGGGAAGSTNISILPFAVGNTSAAATNSSSFVTWNAAGGTFRPLAAAEYSALTSGANTTDNTSVAAATAISASTTVNSVLITGTGTLLTGTGGLNITSGAIMYSPAATTAGTIGADINFGTAEGVISSTAGSANSTGAGLTLSGVISGSGGLTLNSVISSDIALTNAGNTYTGTTTLLGGLTIVSGTIASGSPSIFGSDTSAVVINSSNNSNINGIYASAATTMNRGLSIVGSSNGTAFLITGGAYAFNVGTTPGDGTGSINIAGNTRLDLYNLSGGTTTNALILNGNITGAGSITDNTATTFVTLNGNNTYSGGTNIQLGTYQVGSDTAFGTGTIYFSNAGKIQSLDATAHTIGNGIFLASNPTFQGTGALNFTGGLNLNGSRTLTTTTTNGVTFSGLVSNGALTKAGVGALTLSNANNTYTGGTVINAGTVNANAVGTLGTGALTLSAATSIANINADQNVAGLSGATAGAAVNIANGVNLTLNEPGSLSFSGNITGMGSLTKTGAGTQTLITGTNSFSGGLFINAGQVTASSDNTLGTGNVSLLASGVTLLLQSGATNNYISDNASLSLVTGSIVNLNFAGTPDTINMLVYNGVAQAPGLWGSAASGAPNVLAEFLGTGEVLVLVPEPSTWAMTIVGASLLLGAQRFRRSRRR